MLKVFVYGTLKPGECNYQRYCEGKVVEEKEAIGRSPREAIAYGQLFDLSLGYPAMTVGESPVQGFLLTFADSSILSVLDELEDYQEHRQPEENEYNRLSIATYDTSGKALGLAWAYLMSFEKVKQFGGILMPSGVWYSKSRVGS